MRFNELGVGLKLELNLKVRMKKTAILSLSANLNGLKMTG